MTVRSPEVRPIIVAEHASARFGGEAILPLHYFRFLRRRGVEAWLVVHERTRDELDETLADDRDRIHYVPDTALHLACWNIARRLPAGVASATVGPIMHGATQYAQRRVVKDLVGRVGATVVHEPIPVSPKAPSLTYDVGAPVVIGPMNGGMTFPPGFPAFESRFDRHVVPFARRAAGLVNAMVPGKRKAAALLVANERTRAALPPGSAPTVIDLVENGVDFSVFDGAPLAAPERERTRPRFVFLGRLVAWKAVDLLLRAVAAARTRLDLELDIVGDGNQRASLESLRDELSLGDRVTFRGFIPQKECAPILAGADALVLPSLYECGGAVVLEAMAMGLPVIATRWGGPADYLDDTCGVLIDPKNPEQLIGALADAMERLGRAPEADRRRLGEAGRRRVREQFDWERKVDRIIEIYQDAQRTFSP